jgi:hypothetical protein
MQITRMGTIRKRANNKNNLEIDSMDYRTRVHKASLCSELITSWVSH